MSMDYIRRTYGVTAKRGMVVTIRCGQDSDCRIKARIVGARGQYLRLWIPGARRSHLYHPVDSIDYPMSSLKASTSDGKPSLFDRDQLHFS